MRCWRSCGPTSGSSPATPKQPSARRPRAWTWDSASDVAARSVLGQVATARLMLHDGNLGGGLALLDEVALRLTSGEVDPFTTGIMYCELICAAQCLGLHDRARDWTR